MLHKTRGIVLKSFKYSETSVICKVYTEKFGQQSYIINGVRSGKAKINQGMLQPGSLLDMVVYHKENNGLQRVSEAHRNTIFSSIPFNIAKSAAILFMMEIIYKSIKENEPNQELFDYIYGAVSYLDRQNGETNNFHLFFALQFMQYLGCFPGGMYSKKTPYFSLQEGVFVETDRHNIHCISYPLSYIFSEMLHSSTDTLADISLSGDQRTELLNAILMYYRFHVDRFSNIKSSQVLEEVVWNGESV